MPTSENKNEKSKILTATYIAIGIYIFFIIILAYSRMDIWKRHDSNYEDDTRWVHNVDGTWSYKENGQIIKYKTKMIDGKIYYFDLDGKMMTDHYQYSYYFGSDGAAITNQWKKDWGHLHYYGSDGKMVIDDWVKDGEDYYFVDRSGNKIINNWIEDEGKKYHFDSQGKMQKNQYIRLGQNGTGYLTSDGSLLINGTIENYKADLDGYLSPR